MNLFLDKFPHEATSDQRVLFEGLDKFLNQSGARLTYVLQGYAGTGKTTSIGALIKVLPTYKYKYKLMAPTGRASKVMGSYANARALTIHKSIYEVVESEGGRANFKVRANNAKDTVFIVDEVSMVGDKGETLGSGLVQHLMRFVCAGENTKLILVGDTAQLPPVGQRLSPALDLDRLRMGYRCEVYGTTLKQVTRQAIDSGILFNATKLRQSLGEHEMKIAFETSRFNDMFRMNQGRIEDGIRYAHDKFGVDKTAIICRSNRDAVAYNQYVRRQILFYEDEIAAGELIMAVKNNYSWLPKDKDNLAFIANGEMLEVRKIRNLHDQHGFRFATLELAFLDDDSHAPFEAMCLLDTLHSHATSMTEEEYTKLRSSVLLDYQEMNREELAVALKGDPYLNALQIKFAYALTCHKSQGGQWPCVFLDQGWLPDEHLDIEYLRWLYTALTRASKELFLLNFKKEFFA